VALYVSCLAAVRRCWGCASTRRTKLAEQPATVEPVSETAPLDVMKTTPPYYGCEEEDSRGRQPWPSLSLAPLP
jgi:hypothetical protein